MIDILTNGALKLDFFREDMEDQGRDHAFLIVDMGLEAIEIASFMEQDRKVFCVISPPDITKDQVREISPKGIVISDGTTSASTFDKSIFDLQIPVIGVGLGCYIIAGLQLIKSTNGGSERYEISHIAQADKDSLMGDCEGKKILEICGTSVKGDDRFVFNTAQSDGSARSGYAVAIETGHLHGLNFYPHVKETTCGRIIFDRFVNNICLKEVLVA